MNRSSQARRDRIGRARWVWPCVVLGLAMALGWVLRGPAFRVEPSAYQVGDPPSATRPSEDSPKLPPAPSPAGGSGPPKEGPSASPDLPRPSPHVEFDGRTNGHGSRPPPFAPPGPLGPPILPPEFAPVAPPNPLPVPAPLPPTMGSVELTAAEGDVVVRIETPFSTRVPVFYATDRASFVPDAWHYFGCFLVLLPGAGYVLGQVMSRRLRSRYADRPVVLGLINSGYWLLVLSSWAGFLLLGSTFHLERRITSLLLAGLAALGALYAVRSIVSKNVLVGVMAAFAPVLALLACLLAWHWGLADAPSVAWGIAIVVGLAVLTAVSWKISMAALRIAMLIFGMLVVGVVCTFVAFACVRTHVLAERLGRIYGNDLLEQSHADGLPLTLGLAEVSIPKDRPRGRVPRPRPWSWTWADREVKDMVLLHLDELSHEVFFTRLGDTVLRSDAKDVLVFVHGFNVSFEAAMLRTAQIAYDLDFQGASLCYAWPSEGGLGEYTHDAENVRVTAPHLEALLSQLKARCGAQKVHVIAHSMGSRALMDALYAIGGMSPVVAQVDHVVWAAPDVGALDFQQKYERLSKAVGTATLYASARDSALAAAVAVGGLSRLGRPDHGIVVRKGMDTIDVTEATGDHSAIGNDHRVLDDLIGILEGLTAEQRAAHTPRLHRCTDGTPPDLCYWILRGS